MKHCFIFTLVFAAASAFVYAEDTAPPPPTDPAKSAAAESASKNSLALIELDKKEATEIRSLQEKAADVRKRLLEETKNYQNQIAAVKEKYRAERYAIMDRITPGSGSKLAKKDKDLADLESQLKKDMSVLNMTQRAEASKKELTKEKQDKLQAERNRVVKDYNEKRRKILSE